MLHRREKLVDRKPQRPRPATALEPVGVGGVSRWASTCRSCCCSCLAILFASSASSASRAADARGRTRQGGAVRVRHRAHQRAARALRRRLLPGGDAVHHVRHRDRLPVPVRGRRAPSSARTASGRSSCSASCSSSRSSTRWPRAGSTGARCAGPAARPRRCRPSARAPPPSAASGSRAAPRRGGEAA